MPSVAWLIIEGPLLSFTLAIVLALAAMALLSEYRRLFMTDPKSVMSIEVLMRITTRTGDPAYCAAFLLFAALLSFACALFSLAVNIFNFLSR